MNYITISIFVILGILILVIGHLVWRGMVTIARKAIFDKVFEPKNKNGGSKKVTYADTKYKNQQLIISIAGFLLFLLVLAIVFIWLPDMWVGYQIILCVTSVLVPGALFGVLISRRKD